MKAKCESYGEPEEEEGIMNNLSLQIVIAAIVLILFCLEGVNQVKT